ncbi:MAG: carboxylate--amine ligase, partial [Deltaproteobacteria bacterium]|nr:carboxylate--amine ligase [Deltaproteobacteria bacterium]
AALIQCLIVWIDSQYQKGQRSRQIHMQHYWLAPENKWQAARYGLDGQIIVQEGTERKLLRSHLAELLQTLAPTAQSLRCEKELKYVEEILKRGSSAARQRMVFSKTNSLKAVASALVKELKDSIE